MEILEAFDLTGSYRAAAELAGCDHHTVAHYVALREAGRAPKRMCAERVEPRVGRQRRTTSPGVDSPAPSPLQAPRRFTDG